MNNIKEQLNNETYNKLDEEIFKLTQLQSLLTIARYGIDELGYTKEARRALYRIEDDMYDSIKKLGEMMGIDYFEMT